MALFIVIADYTYPSVVGEIKANGLAEAEKVLTTPRWNWIRNKSLKPDYESLWGVDLSELRRYKGEYIRV